ncbi:hypothetical protein JRO89_XS12G0137800 [Xanthoceras sorbifolium]|uniref:UBA domain-containing protein n=1 Tax=Xanthoceras sorbifolium TaxID=99658 RepID=A0ABQ8HCL1_9ROSI|nr:hypothetical protein JRO89_XS12G0137800 [Xanthoceras sorbifolium]
MATEVVAQSGLDAAQPHYDVKLFNRWTFEDVQVIDMSLCDYIGVQAAKHATYVPHTAGRYSVKRFRKAQCPIVERLTNSLMMHGRNNGKKLMAVRIVKHAMEIIHLLTDQNPIQVIVDAVINSGPREDATRIGSAGVVRRQAVDISPLRRVNQAIYLLTTGARESAFRNIKTIAECLADELFNAAKGSSNRVFCLTWDYGLFNFLIPGTSFYSSIEASSWLSTCTRRPKFILCTGGNPSGHIPTYSGHNTNSSGLFSGNIWRNLSSWMPQRETSSQRTQDSQFPGRGRTLGSGQLPVNSDSNLEARLLDNSSPDRPAAAIGTGEQLSDRRVPGALESIVRLEFFHEETPFSQLWQPAVDNAVAASRGPATHQVSIASDEEIQKLVSMGFEKVEVALAAADGDLNVAVEILMSQLG